MRFGCFQIGHRLEQCYGGVWWGWKYIDAAHVTKRGLGPKLGKLTREQEKQNT